MRDLVRDLDLVAVGEALMDMVAPEALDLVSAPRFTPVPGGAPANVAAAVARLGGRAALISAVGDDPFGVRLEGVLREHSVDVAHIRRVPQHTSLAFVARNAGGIPDFLFYRGADAVLSPADIPPAVIARARILYVTSMPLLTSPSREATLHAMDVARQGGTLIAADPNLRPSSWPSLEDARGGIARLLAVDVLKVNDEEARLLTGEPDLDRALRALPARLTLITLGERGVLWRFRNRIGTVPAPRATIVDTTGAGDAFMGALLTEIARHVGPDLAALDEPTLLASLRIACALACTRPGAMPALPSRSELEALLAVPATDTGAASDSRPSDSARPPV